MLLAFRPIPVNSSLLWMYHYSISCWFG